MAETAKVLGAPGMGLQFGRRISLRKGKAFSMIKDQMEKIYKSIPPENIPWNMESPPDILRALVQTKKVSPCKVIELGCGTGNYVIFLSSMGFDATGVDISSTAIEMAKNSASKKIVSLNFSRLMCLAIWRKYKKRSILPMIGSSCIMFSLLTGFFVRKRDGVILWTALPH